MEEEQKWYHIELLLTEKERDKLRKFCVKNFKIWLCKEK